MFLHELLNLLSANKKYPKYQHERRIDIFLQFFLPNIIESQFHTPVTRVLPEFPLRRPDSSQATNIDYLVYSESANVAYICEFKTDPLSFRAEQAECYFQAIKDGWAKILADVRQIRQDTSAAYESKYKFLLGKAEQIPADVKLKILYLAPETTRAHLEHYSNSPDFLFLPLEELKTMQIATSFNEEWSLVRNAF